MAIEVEGRRVAICGKGDYVGEIGVMSEEPATANAIADGPIRVLSFPAARLRKFLRREKAIAAEMELGFRHGLRQKLVRANAAIAEMAADSAA